MPKVWTDLQRGISSASALGRRLQESPTRRSVKPRATRAGGIFSMPGEALAAATLAPFADVAQLARAPLS
ncbi:MAG: hypothetical protein QOH13_1843 [Thermoleophilaceae bacterium]|nr:hypothetical protein [Thermoleophilaceae bacterium]